MNEVRDRLVAEETAIPIDAHRATDGDALAAYVRACADALELRDWRFTLADEPLPIANRADLAASIQCTRHRKHACLWIPPSWWDNPPNDRRQTVAHELLHCHAWPVEQAAEALQTNLGDHTWGVFAELHKGAIEDLIDAVADALAPHLPPPPAGTACPEDDA